MLANAVRSDKAAKRAQDQPKTLSQQIFSSSPPAAAASLKESGHGSQKFIGLGRVPLQAHSTATLNGSARSGPTVKPYKNPLKRSSSSYSTMSDTSGPGKSRKLSTHTTQGQNSGTLSRHSSGVNQALHHNVTFDENDFSDADESDLILLESMSKPKTPPTRARLQSSGAVPWSSSPESHRYPLQSGMLHAARPSDQVNTAPKRKPLLSRQLTEATPSEPVLGSQPNAPESSSGLPSLTQIIGKAQNILAPAADNANAKPARNKLAGFTSTTSAGANENIPIQLDDSPKPVTDKPRKLPWLQGQTYPDEEANEQTSRRVRRPKKEKLENAATTTPAPKLRKDNQDMWEQTASAVKAEQKKLRQQQGSAAEPKVKQGQDHGEDQPLSDLRKVNNHSKKMAEVFLSSEQQNVLNLVVDKRKSVFFTGPAGTGKSVLTREIIVHLKRKYKNSPESVAVTASTGLAACNIGGCTLHSYSGIGLGKESAEQLAKKVKKNGKAVQRWNRTKVLIIDEISMVDGALFDKLEQVARIVRKKPVCFGGIQLVVTGDFFQLPPVSQSGSAAFAFDAGCWKTAIDHTIGLTHVFRQKDPVFAGMLNEMRVGKLSSKSIDAFRRLQRPISEPGEISTATELYPRRYEVEAANKARMDRLIGDPYEYTAIDGGTIQDEKRRSDLLNNCMAPQSITFKKGAQVMLIKNIDENLVNGSIGEVRGFMTSAEFDAYDANEEKFLSSGGDLDKMRADGVDLQAFRHKTASTEPRFPLVRFTDRNGHSIRELLCTRETWKMEQPNGEVLASRMQVPLILAWALSIHKAQGQTLEKVKVDLNKIFEKGQAYVALSRATSQEGLQIENFSVAKVMAHEKVRRFYDTLYGVDTIGGSRKKAPPVQADQTQTAATEASYDDFQMTAEDEAAMLAYIDG